MKYAMIKWLLDVCVCLAPVYFLFDMIFIYGYARLAKYSKESYRPYLKGAIILTVILAVNCLMIGILNGKI